MKKRIAIIILLILLIILLNLLFLSQNIAEFFSVNISRYINIGLGAVTSLVDFSIAEWVFLGLIISLVLGLIVFALRLITLRFSKVKKTIFSFIITVLSLVLVISLTITSGYSRKTIDAPLNLAVEAVDDGKLKNAAEYYSAELIAANVNIQRGGDGNVLLPYTFSELSDLLNEEFNKLNNNYFTDYNFKAKPVIMSKPMTYFISGVYFPLTAEANVSTISPPYQLPVTMAHELSHSRGVMREDEANFLAYYICINSDNIYLKYCGLMHAAIITINNFAAENYDDAKVMFENLPEEIRTEFKNASDLYDKYDNELLTSVSEFFNNIWLKSNKVSQGTASYSDTAKRLYALYKNLNQI